MAISAADGLGDAANSCRFISLKPLFRVAATFCLAVRMSCRLVAIDYRSASLEKLLTLGDYSIDDCIILDMLSIDILLMTIFILFDCN